MKVVAVIPAHLASTRFPRKILLDLYGLPMIEHVRRRALLSNLISEVYVSTCDKEIADIIEKHGGNVIISSAKHKNGTSRVAETINKINCSHVIMLQGDEPLIIPRYLNKLVNSIKAFPNIEAFNLTGPIKDKFELKKLSFVKCMINNNNEIQNCFRRDNLNTILRDSKKNIRKILGIISFKKKFLKKLMKLPMTIIEKQESIEQMRIIENNYKLISVPISLSLPSINEPDDEKIVLDVLRNDKEQRKIFEKIN